MFALGSRFSEAPPVSVVLITGASSGMGAATAVEFAKIGKSLVLVGRNAEKLQKTKESCVAAALPETPVPHIIVADLGVDENVRRIIAETISKFSRLDVLVNCAGIGLYKSIKNGSMDEFDEVMRVNLRAPYLLTKLAIPHLERSKGNIVNVSSVMSYRGFTNVNAYSTSKAALDQFTRCTALELAPKKIRVNVVSPGFTTGNFQKSAGVSEDAYNALVEASKESYPLGRAGDPEDVADAIVFLASDKAKFITGAVLPVDGGKNLQCPR